MNANILAFLLIFLEYVPLFVDDSVDVECE